MVFGLGKSTPKGYSAELTLAKTDYYSTEVVQGQLTLTTVGDTVECTDFKVTLLGDEILRWSVNADGIERFDVHCDVLRLEIPLLPTGQSSIPPGEHVFPFAVRLPPSLPATHETPSTRDLARDDVIHAIEYSITAEMVVKGNPKPKQLGRKVIKVYELVQPPQAMPGKPTTASDTQLVTVLCCLDRGTCGLVVRTDCDATDLYNGRLELNGSVQNMSSLAVRALRISVQQDVLVHIPPALKNAWSGLTRRCIHSFEVPLDIAPQTTRGDILLEIPVGDIARRSVQKYSEDSVSALVPTCTFKLASVKYNVCVEILLKESLINSLDAMFSRKALVGASVELPTTLLLLGIPSSQAALPHATRATEATIPAEAPRDLKVVEIQ